jgi:hypothetical protein
MVRNSSTIKSNYHQYQETWWKGEELPQPDVQAEDAPGKLEER